MSNKFNLRVRSSTKGVQNLSSIDNSLTLSELQSILQESTGIRTNKQKVLYGYPPKPLIGSLTEMISKLGISNGDTLTVEELPSPRESDPPVQNQPPSTVKPQEKVQPKVEPSVPAAQPSSKPTIAHIEADDGSLFQRRVVDADNSCLFNSVGYVLENHSRTKSKELREVIARTVLSKPDIYNEAFLGKTPEEYAKWIRNTDSWGGAIELSILSEHYQTEISAFDTQTKRMDNYGEGNNYAQRVYLIYDGIHYDPLALTFDKSMPEDMDVTVFAPNDNVATAKANEVVSEAHKSRAYVDTANFDIRCLVCNQGIKGEKGIVEHSKKTGHTNFAEYQ